MTKFIAVANSTMYDVCQNTYGTLNLLGKLLDDNNVSVNYYPNPGDVFLYDENLVNVAANQNLSQNYTVAAGDVQIKYATR